MVSSPLVASSLTWSSFTSSTGLAPAFPLYGDLLPQRRVVGLTRLGAEHHGLVGGGGTGDLVQGRVFARRLRRQGRREVEVLGVGLGLVGDVGAQHGVDVAVVV